MEKFQKRLVKVTKEHNEECKQLLKLMGIPYVDVSEVIKGGEGECGIEAGGGGGEEEESGRVLMGQEGGSSRSAW